MTSLRSFIITRIILLLPMLWFLITLVFILLRVLPGDPVKALSPQLPAHQTQAISEELGLNRPIFDQYIDFLRSILSLDFGTSINSKMDVGYELQLKYGATVTLTVFSVLIGIPLGTFLGGYAGVNREKFQDHAVRLYTIAVYALPIFLLGILMQILFSYKTGILIPILPPLDLLSSGATKEFTHYTEIWLIDSLLSGRPDITFDILVHLIMPCICLGMLIASTIARQVRTHMIHQLEQEYVQFARARGLPENDVVYKETLKNSAIPTIGLIGLMIALLLAGAVLTETTFNIPGLGRYIFTAIQNRDFPAVQGGVVIFTLVVGLVSLLSDVIYAILDPRIRY